MMDILERDRVAAMCVALRPDWATNGIDKLKAMRTWLSANLMTWAYRDAIVGLGLVAADPASNGPARLLTDGPWRTALRHLAGTTTDQPLTEAELGGDCGICGVRQAMHRGWRILSDDIGEHEWVAAPKFQPATPERIRAIHASAHGEAGQRLPSDDDGAAIQRKGEPDVSPLASAFREGVQA